MRKNIFFLFFSILTLSFFSQVTYPSLNINMLSHLDPEKANAGDGRNYSGCWGWYQSTKNKEYAIVGTSAKTYFIDVTNPLLPKICDSVMGHSVCTWRELKTYQNYCYVVSDVCKPNAFQIIDMKYLPDSVHVVFDDSTTYFQRAHTVWVDGNKMYVGGNAKPGFGSAGMNVYSLATPTAPVLLRTIADDYPSITYVHDMYVRNDTVYASAGGQGLQVLKLTSSNTFTLLGSLTTYPESGYNHSSWLTPNGKTLVFCDENLNLSIKVADVSNLSNITPVALVRPNFDPNFIAHNPYVVSNEWVYVSCYQDGLMLYDISTPSLPTVKGFFDTYPQGGSGAVTDYGGACCRGNWGAYPYLPSGIIIAVDMQNGIFILKPSSLISVKEEHKDELAVNIYPNPASTNLNVTFANDESKNQTIEITNVLGEIIYSQEERSDCGFPVIFKTIDVSNFSNGTYLINITTETKTHQQKFIISK